MTAKDLIKQLLEMPDLDVPVVIQSPNSGYKFNIARVQGELDSQDNWIIQIDESTEIYQPDQHPERPTKLDCGCHVLPSGNIAAWPQCPTHWTTS